MSSWLIVTAALAAALMGGIFFAFSSFVMPALGRIPPAEGIRAMQRINIDVFHWSFVIVFFGTPALCIGLIAQGLGHWHEAGAPWIVGGGAVYLVGCLMVTGGGNVPLNNALAKVDAEEANPALEWQRYAQSWILWNHVRTAACLIAAAAFLTALAV